MRDHSPWRRVLPRELVDMRKLFWNHELCYVSVAPSFGFSVSRVLIGLLTEIGVKLLFKTENQRKFRSLFQGSLHFIVVSAQHWQGHFQLVPYYLLAMSFRKT